MKHGNKHFWWLAIGPIGLALIGADRAGAQTHLIQQGNVLDANLQLGSGGLNRPLAPSNINSANRIVTGNVTGGQSFRGYSPVGDPSTLFQIGRPYDPGRASGIQLGSGNLVNPYSSLPSEQLYAFNRDSFNLAEAQAYQSAYGNSSNSTSGLLVNSKRPYYSPYSTTTDVGSIISDMNRPNSALIRNYGSTFGNRPSTDPLAGGDTYSQGGLLQVPTYLVRADTGQTLPGTVNPQLLQSTLFGNGFREVPVPVAAADAQRSRYLAPPTPAPVEMNSRTAGSEPLDPRIDLRSAQIPTEQSMVGKRPGTANSGSLSSASPLAGPSSPRSPGEKSPTPLIQPGTPGLENRGQAADRSASGLRKTPEGDMIRPVTPMGPGEASNAKGSSLRRPVGTGQAHTPGTGGPAGTAGQGPGGQNVIPAQQILQAMGEWPSEPIKTFVGPDRTQTNKYLADGERLLKAGQYYKAADQYNLARTVDVRNPLPLLGRSMALLAAGEYLTSASNLFLAIRQMGNPALFAIDLKTFLPDLAMLDRRRADLERRLEQSDNFRLRFLLGFAEYCSGLKKLGLTNLEKAATAAPPELSDLAKFVEQLKSRDAELSQPIRVEPEKPAGTPTK